MIRAFLLLGLGLLLGGCADTIHGKALAEPQVTRFHRLLNGQQFAQIYGTATPGFQAALSKEKCLALFAAIERKLGRFQTASEVNWRVNTYNLQTSVVLVYRSSYAGGVATERFTYRIADGKAVLSAYDISSLDMMIK
jgi:hypothetical protein